MIGFVLIFGPVLADPRMPKSFWEIYKASFKTFSLGQTFFLALAGTVMQVVLNPTERFLVAMCFVAVLPILAIVEMTIDPTSHNLLPIEFMEYGFIGGIIYLGMRLGSFVRRHLEG